MRSGSRSFMSGLLGGHPRCPLRGRCSVWWDYRGGFLSRPFTIYGREFRKCLTRSLRFCEGVAKLCRAATETERTVAEKVWNRGRVGERTVAGSIRRDRQRRKLFEPPRRHTGPTASTSGQANRWKESIWLMENDITETEIGVRDPRDRKPLIRKPPLWNRQRGDRRVRRPAILCFDVTLGRPSKIRYCKLFSQEFSMFLGPTWIRTPGFC